MDTSKELCRCIYKNDAYKGFKNWIYSDDTTPYYNYEHDMQSYIDISDRNEIRGELEDIQAPKILILKRQK